MKKTSSKFRLLPIIIFLCVIIFSLKIESMWEETSSGDKIKTSFLSLPSAQAQKVDNISDKKPEEKTENTDDEDSEDANYSVEEPKLSHEIIQPINPDIDQFSENELQVLQDLARRRKEIEEQEKQLELKIATINAAEIQIDKKVIQLQELEKSIKKLVAEYDEKEKSQLDSLVLIYASMKPKDAARIFNDLDMEILIKLFSQMKESKAATILSAMDSAKANALTLELANKDRPEIIKTQ